MTSWVTQSQVDKSSSTREHPEYIWDTEYGCSNHVQRWSGTLVYTYKNTFTD